MGFYRQGCVQRRARAWQDGPSHANACCLYEAPSPDAIMAAAARAGVPADEIVEVGTAVPQFAGRFQDWAAAEHHRRLDPPLTTRSDQAIAFPPAATPIRDGSGRHGSVPSRDLRTTSGFREHLQQSRGLVLSQHR